MSEKGKRVLNIFKRIGIGLSIGFNVVFLIAVIIGSSGLKKQNNNVNCALAENDVQEVVRNYGINKRLVSYNDSDYSITLSVEELNNIEFVNLTAYRDTLESGLTMGSWSYNGVSYNFTTASDEANKVFSSSVISFNSPRQNNLFRYRDSSTGPTIYRDLEYDLIITLNSTYYEGFKNAIELDIPKPITSNIFESLTDSVVGFVGSLGSGIVAMTSVFYDSVNSELTTIGLLSVIVVAVSLAYFLFRLIIGLIRMRG